MSDIASALVSLRAQSIARGLGGRLEDFDIALCEDGATISIYAFFSSDVPLMASFAATGADSDLAPYYHAADRYAAATFWLH